MKTNAVKLEYVLHITGNNYRTLYDDYRNDVTYFARIKRSDSILKQ